MVLVSVVPVLAAGFLSVWSITLSHKIDVANLETALIEQKYNEIKRFMDNTVLGNIIVNVSYEQTTDVAPQDQKFLLGGILERVPGLEWVSFINLEGRETTRLTRLEPDGVSEEDLRNWSGIEGFSEAKAENTYLSPVHFTLNGPMVTVLAPAKNKNGVVIFVTAAEANLEKIREVVENASLGSSGYVYLADQSGSFIVGSGPFDNIGGGTSLEGVGIISGLTGRSGIRASDWKISARREDAKDDITIKRDFLGTEGQRKYESFFGEKVVAAGRFLPEYNWALIAEWPVKEADASVNELIYNNGMVSIAVFAAAVGASILLATFIVRPVKTLEAGTERVAQGKFEEKIEIKTGDELEELGAAFNKMMAGLKRLEELKEEFVFVAAHELRTPVAAMKGYLSLILDGTTGGVNDRTKDFITKVIQSNNRLVQLVNDLLEVSRSEAGRLTIRVSPIDLVSPIHDVLVELEKMAEEKHVQLVHETLPQMPKILADPDRLKEVLVNLVGNSIKYMGGSGTVTISHELKANELITHIKDTGIGMSKEAQEKLFEKFYRIATDKTREITGTGLGLFIVKEIIEKMNGKIWATSEGEGKGSTFSFSLPVAK